MCSSDLVASSAKERLDLSALLIRPDGIVAWASDSASKRSNAAAIVASSEIVCIGLVRKWVNHIHGLPNHLAAMAAALLLLLEESLAQATKPSGRINSALKSSRSFAELAT